MNRLTFLLLLRLSSCAVVDGAADGYFMCADFWCAFYSREHVEYLIDWYFNEEFTMQYNSTVGGWTGLTAVGLLSASTLNNDRHDVLQKVVERQLISVNNVSLIYSLTEDNFAEPVVTLADTTSSSLDTMLVCSAYDFYPKHIRITWLCNGQEVTSGVTLSEVMTNGDWTYQVHSFLEITPGRKDKIRCMVQHASLKEPTIIDWDSALNKSERSYLIGGFCCLLLGAVFLSSGMIQYRRKSCNFTTFKAFYNPASS